MLKKQKQSQKLRAAREYHTSFESPNMQHVEFFTEHWRKVTNLFGKRNTFRLKTTSDQAFHCLMHFLKKQGRCLY